MAIEVPTIGTPPPGEGPDHRPVNPVKDPQAKADRAGLPLAYHDSFTDKADLTDVVDSLPQVATHRKRGLRVPKTLVAAGATIVIAAGTLATAFGIISRPGVGPGPSETPKPISSSFEPNPTGTQLVDTPPPSVNTSPTVGPTLPATPSAEVSLPPEQGAPNIDGLQKKAGSSGDITYYAQEHNKYGLAKDAVAGYYDPNVEMKYTDGTTTEGALDLHTKVIEQLGVDGDHIVFPIDVGKNGQVKITFDNHGAAGTPEALLSFEGKSFPIGNAIPQDKNNGIYCAVTDPGKYFNWRTMDQAWTVYGLPTPITDDTAISNLLVYGKIGTSSSLDAKADINWNSPLQIGTKYANVQNSLSISIVGTDGEIDTRPVNPLLVGGKPVFTQSFTL